MFRSSWYSARYTGGEAEAAPLAAGGSQSEVGAARRPVPQRRRRILRTSCILEKSQADRVPPPSRRPRSRYVTFYVCKFIFLLKLVHMVQIPIRTNLSR